MYCYSLSLLSSWSVIHVNIQHDRNMNIFCITSKYNSQSMPLENRLSSQSCREQRTKRQLCSKSLLFSRLLLFQTLWWLEVQRPGQHVCFASTVLKQRGVIWTFFHLWLTMAENGKHIELVKTLQNEFQCGICKLLLCTPFQCACGQRYCEDCIKDFMTS
mgnify:CR=1 FL=1